MYRGLLVAFVLLSTLSGCVSTHTRFNDVDFEGEDDNVPFPTLRASFLVASSAPAPGEPIEDAEQFDKRKRGWRFMIDGAVSHGQGNFTQNLADASTRLRLEGDANAFFGPGEVRGAFKLTTGSIMAHGQGFVTPFLAFDLLGGLAITDAHLRASQNGARDRTNRTSLGPQFGVGVSIFPIPIARLYGNASYTLGFHAGDEAELSAFEAGLSLEAIEGVSLFGAYRLWRYRGDKGGDFRTDIDIDAQGPAFGVELLF